MPQSSQLDIFGTFITRNVKSILSSESRRVPALSFTRTQWSNRKTTFRGMLWSGGGGGGGGISLVSFLFSFLFNEKFALLNEILSLRFFPFWSLK